LSSKLVHSLDCVYGVFYLYLWAVILLYQCGIVQQPTVVVCSLQNVKGSLVSLHVVTSYFNLKKREAVKFFKLYLKLSRVGN
jgi:hypothetical protein